MMADSVQNPFATAEGARRYQAGRPFHHPRAIERIFSIVGGQTVRRALDLACGTGLSTLALFERAELAVGVDSVESMVRLAQPSSTGLFAVSEAERLPFSSGIFDLITVSSGVHWFDQSVFFDEAARVLVRHGWVALDDHFFEGSVDQPDIDTWLSDHYAVRYTPPVRAARADREMVLADGFMEIDAFEYDDPISFSQDELVAYLLSHSNTITSATQGRETTLETESWLREETGDWFGPPDHRTFLFRGAVRCLRRTT